MTFNSEIKYDQPHYSSQGKIMTMSASGSDCDVVIARLAAMMTDYATQLNGLLPASPYTPPQVSQALMLIQNTRGAILSYLQLSEFMT